MVSIVASSFPLQVQNLPQKTQAVWELLEGKTLTNHQGYKLSFGIEEGQLLSCVEKHNIFRQRVKVVVLSDYILKEGISPRDLTFDLTSRCLIVGKKGLFGGGCAGSKAAQAELVEQVVEMASPFPQVYVEAGGIDSSQAEQVVSCFRDSQIKIVFTPAAATHYFLFITDAFLKSKELLLPLMAKMNDPFFKQRLFPIVVDKNLSIFSPGTESYYVNYWSNDPEIQKNIAPFIRALRDTLMPPLEELLQSRLATVTEAIKSRTHLLENLTLDQNLPKPNIVQAPLILEDLMGQLNISREEASLLSKALDNHPGRLAEAVAYIKQSKITPQAYLEYYKKSKDQLLAKQQKAQVIKGGSSSTASSLPSVLDPSPQAIQKYQHMPHDQLIKEFKSQGLQLFVSYSQTVMDQVNKIDNCFKGMGIELLRDARELHSFASVKEFMKKVIREADYTFSVINPTYLKSFYCIFEILTTLQDPNWRQRIFPLVIPGTDLSDEAILSYQTHWQQEAERYQKTGASPEEIALAQEISRNIAPFLRFVRDLQPQSINDQLSTLFHQTMALMLARQERLEKKGIYKQAIFHLPMGRNRDFTGREKEMASLEESLKKGTYSAITNTGMGGVGKSQLALEYAYRHEKEYEMVYWIRSESIDLIKTDLRSLGLQLGIGEDFLKDENVLSTMRNALEKRKSWLLVFDNAEDPDLLAKVMPQKGGHILVTSRHPNWDKAVSVDVFSKEEALAYLQKISGISGQQQELALLAQELGYLPLALTQAGAYIRRQQITVASYLSSFKEGQKQFLSQKERGYPGSVATAWLLSIENITQEDPNALHLLNMCGYLAPDRIPQSLLNGWLKQMTPQTTDLELHDALRILESYSLIDQKVEQKEGTQKKWISIHRLIQTVTRDQIAPAETQITLPIGISTLNQQFDSDAGTVEEREAGEAFIEHAKALTTHAEQQGIKSKELGALFCTTGIFLKTIGHLQEAKETLQRALKIIITCLGTENHTDVAAIYNNLGVVLQDQGDLKGAKEYHEKALKIEIAYLGTENHADVAASYNNLGLVLENLGDLKGAKEYQEKALKIRIKCYGNEIHADVATSYNNLGLVLQAQGDLKGAKEYHKKALKIRIACYSTENHTEVAASYNNLGMALQAQGDLKGAKESYEKAVGIYIACLGTENHTSVAKSYNNLGMVLKAQGDLKGAKEYHEKALKIEIACLGTENHTSVATSYGNLGNVLQDQGDLNGAKEYQEKALKIRIACYGTENHMNVAASYYNLGMVLKDQGDLKGAKECHEKALKIRINCYGTENYTVAQSYTYLGNVYLALKQLDKAREHYVKAKQISHQLFRDKYDKFFDGKIKECG